MTRNHFFFRALLALLVMGCGRGLPTMPANFTPGSGFEAVEQEAPVGLDSDPPLALMLHPGDVVTMQTISATTSELSGLTVDERGVLHIPLAGDVDVADLDLTTAEQRIEQAIRPFDQTARVTLLLTAPNGQRASVLGAVASPGRFDIVAGMRLADLMAVAGGTSTIEEDGFVIERANLHGARLVRNGEVVPVSLALALTGDQRHNVRIRPGDHLYVPPLLENLVSVIGEVRAARVFRYRNGLRLSRALALAGGTTRDADHSDLIIIRNPGENQQVYAARFNDVLNGDATDPLLAPGDVVYVHSSGLANFRDAMSAIAPIISVGATAAIGAAVITSTAP